MSTTFTQLLEEVWEYKLRENPLFATYVGDRRYNNQLPSLTMPDIRRRAAMDKSFLTRLHNISKQELSPADNINYQVFEQQLLDDIAEDELQTYLMPVNNRHGFQFYFAELPNHVPMQIEEDYVNYIARLQGFGTYVAQYIELMRVGIHDGMMPSKLVLDGFDKPIPPQITENPAENLLLKPFMAFPKQIAQATQQKLLQEAQAAIRKNVAPAYQNFITFMNQEYLPAGRSSIAATSLPNGRKYYEFLVRYHTTLPTTPEEIHQIGLAEVERISKEMEEIVQKVNFKGSLNDFFEYLRTDERFYVKDPEQLLKEVSYFLKKMDGELPRLFKKLPRLPYGIKPVPEYHAANTTTAYYMPPMGDGSRGGFYYVNTYSIRSRPLHEMESLSYHEAVPGHHLQLALQQELENLPPFRRFAHFSSFIEGWALYAERLALEVGAYQNPYNDFGRLTYEIWRACRLVVDTGMHCLGWSRQQAIDYMSSHSALTAHNIGTEVDRYIAWPAQALSYKMGEIKLRELRRRTEAALAKTFDLRGFHDMLLANGALPLGVIEGIVDEYIAQTKKD